MLQAASNALTLLAFQALAALAARAAAVELRTRSRLAHAYALEVLHIDLDELDVDVCAAADAVKDVSHALLLRRICPAGLCLLCVWSQVVRLFSLGAWS